MESKKKTRKAKKEISPLEIISKGIYDNGKVELTGKKLPKRKMNVIVILREDKAIKKKDKKKAVDNFVKKWSGVIRDPKIGYVMEKKMEYLLEKYK